jgi:hypothetical protein
MRYSYSAYYIALPRQKLELNSPIPLYLDKNKIKYKVEYLRISYYDSKDKCERTSIPDFYLVDDNVIVEIKSSWTYDEQNMKDKIKAYKKLGYKYKLILDKKEMHL